jgi:hypothetical protein
MSNEIQKYDDTINSVSTLLKAYADTVSDTALGLKIQELSEQTITTVKGIEGPQRSRITQLMLKQNMSNSSMIPSNTAAGQLYTSKSDHIGDNLEFIPIFTHNMRTKWGDDKVECRSLDAITGSKYGECAKCPYGRYVPDERPDCSKGLSYYVMASDLSALYKIDFIKTSAKAGRSISQLASPPHLWTRSFILSSERVVQPKVNYFILKVAVTNHRTSPEVAKVCDMLFEFFQNSYRKAVLMQAEYSRMGTTGGGGGGGGGGAGGVIPAEGEEVPQEINFRDSV